MISQALILLLATAVSGQQVGTNKAEVHPSLNWKSCTKAGGCTTKPGKVVIDANWRWIHNTGGYTNCYSGNQWDKSICSDDKTCAQNCALEGADYAATYGATTSGDALTLKFVTQSQQKNVGSRLYVMADDENYEMFQVLGKEFTFDVDVSNLPCGLNGAAYFISMDKDGGKSKYPTNKAGAKYGTGYCDSQCPRDVKFINGEANAEAWVPAETDVNAGVGKYGSCCAEMDLWEANREATAYTPHPCTNNAQHRCEGDACGGTYSAERYSGDCDPDGCDFNSYRQGDTSFYGPGKKVNTNSKFTVVTQFITGSGGALSEIRRFYVQNGKVIPNSVSKIPGITGNAISAQYCSAQKKVFGDRDVFADKGGLPKMSEALSKGMVLALSLWDDHYANMHWLDSTYPEDNPGKLGAVRGACPTSGGDPVTLENTVPNSSVIYSNIKVGEINSTYTGTL